MGISILLIEDDLDLAQSLIDHLQLDGIVCDYASNGEQGLMLARENEYDVLVLDVMLPELDGYGVCSALRQDGVDTPVLMLTALDGIEDKVSGFNAGTDDYLAKPFFMEELMLRIKALAKRRSGQVQKMTVGELSIDTSVRKAWRDGQELELTPKEWALLLCLVEESPKPVSREKLIRVVWGEDIPDSNSLNVYMHKLRQKLDKGYAHKLIHTITGVGFALREPGDG
ncbi:response regulator transcription factor [Halodesulfovibrio spirochaetisodalis]|uniref:XRE family transcriptional regulator n=1 Tax=Halodesulfovibrio spirochaetisodalis TaxID=1560234 RepID=A0A1B7XFK7_9BACT|nr:response regulator transcription factor [Halodesulfovibrio spirochaetisodalis]OBQ54077.1 XRE family transcriptional regulator [Halodesulfovibrio spirochaetisodalis]